jgi:hypothetical protein
MWEIRQYPVHDGIPAIGGGQEAGHLQWRCLKEKEAIVGQHVTGDKQATRLGVEDNGFPAACQSAGKGVKQTPQTERTGSNTDGVRVSKWKRGLKVWSGKGVKYEG